MSDHILHQVKDIQEGDKTFQVWSNPSGNTWQIRKPPTNPGDPGYSFGSSINHDYDTNSELVVVENNSYVNNYDNSYLSLDVKNQVFEDLKGYQDRGIFPNLANQNTNDEKVEIVSSGINTIGTSGDNNASTTPFQLEPLKIEFGKVDNIIKKLAMRNLIYPIDADFGNTQDYMQINQFTYRAPNQTLFFGKNTDKGVEKVDPSDIASGGLPIGTPREKHLGLVKLPMPNSLADSNNVSWGADQLNALTAAVASGVMGQVNPFVQNSLGELTDDKKNNLEKAGGLIMSTVNQVRQAFKQAGIEVGKGASEFATPGSNLNVLGTTVIGSALLNAFQFGITPETILARGQGVVPNNNLSLLFNSPTLREFTFTWKLTPRSREEAIRVNNIIRFFKQGMAPKKGMNTQTGAGSYFLRTPNVFDLKFKTTTQGGGFFYEGDDINNSVVRIKTCACTGCAVNYTPDGMWNAYERGQPVSVTMSLRFSELEPIFDTDYDENQFNYSPNRPDLQPVPIDAVGY
tara:strand:- start:769 stop:2316 length:1548 start_codon:yes stop_codon:yes gene_type:complete